MSKTGKRTAHTFRKQFNVLKPTLEKLKEIIVSQGYTIVEFNPVFNDDDVATVIEELKLKNFICTSNGFIYSDSKNRILFLNEELSDEEKINVLLHEEGHIFCGHIQENTVLGRDVLQELEANEFTYHILNPSVFERCSYFIRKNKLWLSIVSILFVIGTICTILFGLQNELYGEFYVTDGGNKYHQSKCIHVKNKTNVHRLTKDEFESGDYESCGICLPQE